MPLKTSRARLPQRPTAPVEAESEFYTASPFPIPSRRRRRRHTDRSVPPTRYPSRCSRTTTTRTTVGWAPMATTTAMMSIDEHDDNDENGENGENGDADQANGHGDAAGGQQPHGEGTEGGDRPRRKRRRRRGRGGDKPAVEATAGEGGAAPEARAERERRPEPPRPRRAERPEIAELPPVDFQSMGQPREIYVPVPERAHAADERKIALFCDLENIALGVRDSEIKKFDIDLVLERLLEKGKIIVKKAYCDWERYTEYKRTFHEAGDRADRHPAEVLLGQELRRHQDGGRRHGPLLLQGAPRHLRAALRRLRLLAAGLQAQGEQQVRDRRRREELVVEPPDRQLRRVHLLRGHLARQHSRPRCSRASARSRRRSSR